MQDNVSVIIATIVAVIIIVLFPIYNIATRQDSIANNMVVKATTNFVDEVRNKGYIDKESYGKYLNELNKTGNTYEVEMEVYSPILLADVNNPDVYEEKYEIEYTDEILKDMENSNIFKDEDGVVKSNVKYLDQDDKFYIRVKNTNVTQAQILLDRLLRGKQDERIVVNYGGIVYSNDWEHGENAETISSSVSLSRPLNNNLEEFKYEYITDVYDMYTDKLETIYGIAVRLSDDSVDADKIKFILKYSGVEKIASNTGATDKESIESYVKDYIEIEGIVVEKENIKVEQTNVQEINGAYNYEFIITLSGISYDFDNNPYMKSRVRINGGLAYTKTGSISEINSQEFIVFYEPKDIEITTEVKYYDDKGNQLKGSGTARRAVISVKLNKVDSNIAEVKYKKGVYTESDFKDESFGTSIKDSYNEGRYTTEDITKNGTYTIYAKDKQGREAVKVLYIMGLYSKSITFELRYKYFNFGGCRFAGTKIVDGVKSEVLASYPYKKYEYNSDVFGSAGLSGNGSTSEDNVDFDYVSFKLKTSSNDVIYYCYVYNDTKNISNLKPELVVYDEANMVVYKSTDDPNWNYPTNGISGDGKYCKIFTYDPDTRTVTFVGKVDSNEPK